MLGMVTTSDPGTSGIRSISVALGGGIKEGSLFLIEGETRTGKSVLCEHIAYGVLNSKGSAVAYYSTDCNSEALLSRMESMSLDARHDLVTDRFRVYKMGAYHAMQDPRKALDIIINHVTELPERFRLIIIDSPSPYLARISPMAKLDFLQSCKELCMGERTVVLVLESYVFEKKALARAYAMSDYYLKLKSQDTILETGQVDTRLIKVMEVTKLAGVERWPEGIRFEIKPVVGIQIRPYIQVKI
jgi:archaellum biogenesis ATPase FlaH